MTMSQENTLSNAAHAPKLDRYIRRKEVEAITGLKTSSLYRHMNAGIFPKPKQLGIKMVGWLESDINAWMAARPESTLGLAGRPKMARVVEVV